MDALEVKSTDVMLPDLSKYAIWDIEVEFDVIGTKGRHGLQNRE